MNNSNSTAIPISTNPHLHVTPAPPPPSSSDTLNNLSRRFESVAKKAESLAGNLYNHIRTGPGVIDVAMTRIDQAARVIADGGCNNLFKKEFGSDIHGEKLKKTYVCYLSTTAGPVLGTLYLSNMRVGFRSDNPVWTGYAPNGEPGQWVHYKLVLMGDQLMAVNPSSNPGRPGEKYIVVLTKDGHEFWFMGFISYDKALKDLNNFIIHP